MVTVTSFAQNLVTNPSFEAYSACPGTIFSFAGPTMVEPTVQDWFQATAGTPDYFNTCDADISYYSIPMNFVGFQYPKTGDGYAGIFSIQVIEDPEVGQMRYAEYIETKLSAALTSGHRYFVNYWVSLADFNEEANVVAIDRMGALFRNSYIDVPFDYSPLTLLPQIVSPPGLAFNDLSNWQRVSGMFVASDAEQWMVIGNFTNYDSLLKETVYDGGYLDQMSYYYIDDACVIDLDGLPDKTFYHDAAICVGAKLQIAAAGSLGGFIWDDGSSENMRLVEEPGIYSVKSVDLKNCRLRVDTFNVRIGESIAGIYLGADTVLCSGKSMLLDASTIGFNSYQWNTGDTTSSITVSSSGTYSVQANSECLKGADTIVVSIAAFPLPNLPDLLTLCNGTSTTIGSAQTGYKYYWNTGSEECCYRFLSLGCTA